VKSDDHWNLTSKVKQRSQFNGHISEKVGASAEGIVVFESVLNRGESIVATAGVANELTRASSWTGSASWKTKGKHKATVLSPSVFELLIAIGEVNDTIKLLRLCHDDYSLLLLSTSTRSPELSIVSIEIQEPFDDGIEKNVSARRQGTTFKGPSTVPTRTQAFRFPWPAYISASSHVPQSNSVWLLFDFGVAFIRLSPFSSK
jgi:hypothetical protein